MEGGWGIVSKRGRGRVSSARVVTVVNEETVNLGRRLSRVGSNTSVNVHNLLVFVSYDIDNHIQYSIKYGVLLFIYCFMKIKPKLFAKRIKKWHTELFKTRFTAIAKTSNHSRNPSKGLVTDQECWMVRSVYFSTNTGMENSVLTLWCLPTTVWKCINKVHCLRGMPPVTLVPPFQPFQRFSRCSHKTRLEKTLQSY